MVMIMVTVTGRLAPSRFNLGCWTETLVFQGS